MKVKFFGAVLFIVIGFVLGVGYSIFDEISRDIKKQDMAIEVQQMSIDELRTELYKLKYKEIEE